MLTMLISISAIGYLVFSSWFSSAKQTAKNIETVMDEEVYTKIDSFLDVAKQINQSNSKIIANQILDLADANQRDRFFAGVLSSSNDAMYSFSYGTKNGEYYGARRNENKAIEIMRNNADTDGNSWYYSLNEDLTAGQLAVQAGEFDPRSRAWYKSAVEAEETIFSPIYKHFIMDDLAISLASPIYKKDGNLQGVLGTHMLLTDIGGYLKDAVQKHKGYAVIFEKDSKELIANSMGNDNFTVLQDHSLERYDINEMQNSDIKGAYKQYRKDLEANFSYQGEKEKYYISIEEIDVLGLDWLVLSAIPEGLLMAPVFESMRFAIGLAAILLLLSFIIYIIITREFFKPVETLLQASNAMSSGDLTKRVEIIRNDEIGMISRTFNNVADEMQTLVQDLEATVKERTEKLHNVNEELEEKGDQLRLILDSTAEAIYGIDVRGNCTFCNRSGIKILGYNHQSELLGKNMHEQIHHSHANGEPLPEVECKIFHTLTTRKGIHVEDEVFWKPNGTFFSVAYSSYPQIRDQEIIGAVITFTDITERKQKEEEMQYLICHDALTGLKNRRCFEDNRDKIDIEENLPLSVIFADINGLKMTNDIFGHAVGDKLIQKSAEILKQACRENDYIARMGGDEFTILLPKTNKKSAMEILECIKDEFADARLAAVKCSISLGVDTKINPDQPLNEIIANAENEMYKDKTMNRKTINQSIISTIVETLHTRSPVEMQHSIAVREFCLEVGEAMGLAETEINKLSRTGYLHDIGKIVLDEDILSKDSLTAEEMEEMKQHPVVGYRILNLFDDTLDLAEYVYNHHERWDGKGYPKGLKGEQIPLISRIISIVETYDRVLNRGELPLQERRQKALEVIKKGIGNQFDPEIAKLFVRIKEENKKV